ncbi:MAG: GH36-type glycosyl hydrolase domain-containing protein [Nitrospiria bacterium]
MKLNLSSLWNLVTRVRQPVAPLPDPDEPIRAEIFSIERLEQHGESLAAAQEVTDTPWKDRPLSPRVRENGRVLLDSYRAIAEAIQEERTIAPAAEWFVDNFYIVDKQLREIRKDLPPGFYRKLPKLADGPLQGYPRVFGIAWAFVAHFDSRFDPEALYRFVSAYQRVQPLTIGELWAVAITLRIVLVENIRRLADKIVGSRIALQEADHLANDLLGLGPRSPQEAMNILKRYEKGALPASFAVQLAQRLRDQDPKVTPALHWLDQHLAAQGTTSNELVLREHQQQASMTVTVRNIITSMRLMSEFDWAEFFENTSLVDRVLRTETDFGAMDFHTRDRYRHAIEEISRGSGRSELEIAQKIILKTKSARIKTGRAGDLPDHQNEDPGYYLISKGRAEFEKELGLRISIKQYFLCGYMAFAMPAYLGTITLITVLTLALPLIYAAESEAPLKSLLLFALLALIPASEISIALVNRVITELIGPRLLPRLELRNGITSPMKTLVVVPAFLNTIEGVEAQIEQLEVHYLSNADGDVCFALLSDWMDASAEKMPGDDLLLAAAVEGIKRLNFLHGPGLHEEKRFFIFHRKRLWNKGEQKWMGWERKRGKLHELNRLLRGKTDTSFLPIEDHSIPAPSHVQYVITLDADTRLPKGAVKRLVGTIAHPLNKPRFDPRLGRVIKGYSILQPRITPSLPADHAASIFQRVSSGPSGIDPYAAACSDIYQDLFEEGSYTGKGLYDIDAFEASLAGRIPENALLSHDLFEGLFARAGLVSDVEFVEEFPSHYQVAAARQHRWTRGDWQLFPWLMKKTVPLPLISRWKIFDNLRRSLVAPTAFLTLAVSWLLPSATPGIWTGFILMIIIFPPLLSFFAGLLSERREDFNQNHLFTLGNDLKLAFSQILFAVTLLAHQAWLMTDAIFRTLLRLYFTHRKLLAWITAAQSKSGFGLTLGGFYRRMSHVVIMSLFLMTLVILKRPGVAGIAGPFLLLWIFSPLFAWWISLPSRFRGDKTFSITENQTLRLIGRRTWRFFEAFVGAQDHFLPPDNFQEIPRPVIAHRTSPTNIGLYLLSVISARDFGWIGMIEAVERIEATLGTMQKLERFRGHFYNWYDTQDLRPMEPLYISSVDSGNLAGDLLTLRSACQGLMNQTFLHPPIFSGLEDVLLLVQESAKAIMDDGRTQIVTRKQLDEELNTLGILLKSRPDSPVEWISYFKKLDIQIETGIDIAKTLYQGLEHPLNADVLNWLETVRTSMRSTIRDIEASIPWARMLGEDIPSELAGVSSLKPLLSSASTLTPGRLPELCKAAISELTFLRSQCILKDMTQNKTHLQIDILIEMLKRSAGASERLVNRIEKIIQQTQKHFEEMEFDFLFNPVKKLFSLGYRVEGNSLDTGSYDMLASEARLTSFISIAKGDVSPLHWFHLSRTMTPLDNGSALISWSGSMFEYLMPALVMRSPRGSLLDQTYHLIVRRQIEYGEQRSVPWGISESAYSAQDRSLDYRYSSFGVPGLGFKRGLSEDLVIAPYATALAAMIDPPAAVRNFSRLAEIGAIGPYGFYDAVDYTQVRLPEGCEFVLVKTVMAHHQGMTLVALANTLHNGIMLERFHALPLVQATELLLQERAPRNLAVARPRTEEVQRGRTLRDVVPPVLRRFKSPHDTPPRTHLLSNGRYTVMVTAAGSGYSRWRHLAVTRWKEDVTSDAYGTYIFLRDVESGEVWSAGYQPAGVEPETYEVTFSEDKVKIFRSDQSISTTMEIVVSPEDDAEVRRITLTNFSARIREIEITSYAEIVLAPSAEDAIHTAFSNLFVETEFVPETGALLASRRPRSSHQEKVWAAHVAVIEGETIGGVQYETDRLRFLGRGHGIRAPISIMDGRLLSNTAGSVLDPVFSLRRRIRLAPGATAYITFSTLMGSTREEALRLTDKYHDPSAFDRVITLAWTHAQLQLHHLGITPDEAHLFQRLANRCLYFESTLRPYSELLKYHTDGPFALWAYGISGDVPLILVKIEELENLEIIRQLLRAQKYWETKLLAVDLVILNERAASYIQDLQDSLQTLVRSSHTESSHPEAPNGNVFVLRADTLPIKDREALQTFARAILLSSHGSLADQVMRIQRSENTLPQPLRQILPLKALPESSPQRPELEFFNGLGGFSNDGKEYVIILGEGQWTPAPWINIISNPSFGFQVSESGSSYAWSINSRENQLTAWSNDPVSDPPGEIIYIRDEETGEIWTPTPLPIRQDPCQYVIRHGQGYSGFEHSSHGISLELLQWVPLADPIKIARLKIENRTARTRHLSITAYVEWVLGISRSASAPFIITEMDSKTGALFARNIWNSEFGARIAFADLGGLQTAWTGDRTEFIGRNGSVTYPRALERGVKLSGKVGASLDPCGALQTTLKLRPGGRSEIVFFLGQAASAEEAQKLLEYYRKTNLDKNLFEVTENWNRILGTLQVKTPDRSMDIMLNRWLLYQTLSCRVWARSAFYQAGGAYGFRDQLQDIMALIIANREVASHHLLRAASRQFIEGDVQHWWHPPSGRGLRTHISDDYLWLPYVVAYYIEVTGDKNLLDEIIPFLKGQSISDGQDEAYFEPENSGETGTLFEHCARSLDRSLSVGDHGLPLIGSGDWNDGMNRVGNRGKGESIWLGWFLYAALSGFIELARNRGETKRADIWQLHREKLKKALEKEGWDGDWYKRAYMDDGTPLGSAANSECRIDSIAQSWGVISGAADPARRIRAMAAVEEYLVRKGDGLILLFTPPFDKMAVDPGYIKGYLPGVRENGGQYTHAALWSVMAFALLGDGDKAGELFSILNPINHASTRSGIHRYKVEPYVVAADIYAEPPHVGRGGWTWYTGSASWMYRAGIEAILGFHLRGATLHLNPCIPRAWRHFEMIFHYHSSRYEIIVENPHDVSYGVSSIEVDGVQFPKKENDVPLLDDSRTHYIRVILG